ncbi:MAG: o-succinylbenzoate---CoA ligase [Actinomycetota bacterium]|jgi:O-succinylbenzoic acid--CoA ligase|nr:o-succinylbenzoate---CoA ligase [Actinomycetota bacterium]
MPLVVVRLPPPEAADAIRRAWDMGRGVLVLDPRAPETEIARIVDRLDPDGEVGPDVAAVVVTSGTTGEPKGVELTFGGLQASSRAVSDAIGVRPSGGDRWLCCLPLHHVGGLAVLARSWTVGTPVDVLPRFDVAAVATAVEAGATLVSLVPLMARRLLAAGVDLGRFRKVLIGGGPVPVDLPGTATYGLTETWGGVVHAGHPLDGVDVALGHEDEILVRGLVVMRGYRSPTGDADTAAAFTDPNTPGGGWLRTGDAGAFDGQGRLRVVDRLRDLVKTGGVSVAPTEVEAVLAGHPGVADVCVAGAPDPEWGERVVAYVVPADASAPPTVDALRDFARDRLSAAKLPREVVLVDAVPRTPGGKPVRRLLPSTSHPPGSS